MNNAFWLWLVRFAYRRMRRTTAYRDLPDGIPGVRSVDSPCAVYSPRKPLLGDFRDCQTDGHYLCQECAHRADHSTRPDGEWIKVECVADGSGEGD